MKTMSDLQTDFYVHQATCDQRYKNIEDKLEAGKTRMRTIEIQLYIVIAAIMFGPGFAGELIKKIIGA
jgi:hypothetical protein